MRERKRWIYMAVLTFFTVAVIMVIGPLDLLTHGFFCDDILYSDIAAEDSVEYFSLGGGRTL